MKKKVLMITSRIPYPPIGGYKLKNYNLLKILSKHYDVHLVTITEEFTDDETYKFLSENTHSYKVFRKTKLNFVMSSLNTFLNKEPLQVNYYYFDDVQKYINSIIYDMDCVISTLIRTTKYVFKSSKPKIFDMADSLGQNYKKSLPNVKSFFWKNVYKFEIDRLISYEKEAIRYFDKTFLFNKEEINYFNMPDKIDFIPHGVNEELLVYDKYNESYKNCIAFFGKMDYQPNIDAVIWFIENVIDKLNKEIKFIIVGSTPTKRIIDFQKKFANIEVTGFLNDPYEILKSCLCIVAPMQTGAGIQNKILETMALGTINIISTLAASPILADNTKDYIVLDDPKEIASKVNSIYLNSLEYEKYKINSKLFIKNNFTWTIYEKKYINTIKEILNEN